MTKRDVSAWREDAPPRTADFVERFQRRYENREYGYPPDRPLSDSQRTVPPEMVARATERFTLAIQALRPEYV
jgi:hypothetical protein